MMQVISLRFDFTEMAKRCLGSHWGKRSRDERFAEPERALETSTRAEARPTEGRLLSMLGTCALKPFDVFLPCGFFLGPFVG
jgi:hypothetical protein